MVKITLCRQIIIFAKILKYIAEILKIVTEILKYKSIIKIWKLNNLKVIKNVIRLLSAKKSMN